MTITLAQAPAPTPASHPHYQKGLVWLRRDLRLEDQAALYHALKNCDAVYCVFVFDTTILQELPRADRRIEFIHDSLAELHRQIESCAPGAGLLVQHDNPTNSIATLAQSLGAQAVFCNRDYEPYASARDAQVRGKLANLGISFHQYKDQVLFEHQEILSKTEKPYTVFTPYKKTVLAQLASERGAFYLRAYPSATYCHKLAPLSPGQRARYCLPTLAQLGFLPTNLHELKITTGSAGAAQLLADFCHRIEQYGATRDYPAVKGPSYLSVHLRFGTISIRSLARLAHHEHLLGNLGAGTWLSELIWRDFYMQILTHFPHVTARAFRPDYDAIVWLKGKEADRRFDAWCAGQTGYPLVDAAMRQINSSGYMHNRLRMVAASFLVKHLGLDWRRGEAYFATHLNDFDLAANNGGWQWCASSGCDAQPYFRIFNPITQSEKFDTEGKFIKRYIPELAALSPTEIHAPWLVSAQRLNAAGIELGKNYPPPVVDHASARLETLARYAVVKKSEQNQ